MTWLKSTLILLPILLIGAGCNDPKAFGVGKRPIIPVVKLNLTEDDLTTISEFGKEHPELAKKLLIHIKTQQDLIATYNEEAWDVNKQQLKSLGYSDADVVSVQGERTQWR